MADESQVAMLKRGVKEWNEWRHTRREAMDLSEADLHDAQLSHVNFAHAQLNHANLTSAVMHAADLTFADLGDARLDFADLFQANLMGSHLALAKLANARLAGADLRASNLTRANLAYANLSGADLSGANLRGAELIGALFKDADLAYADLSYARIEGAVFAKVDLSRTFGLAKCVQNYPSSLDIQTLQRSAQLPIRFLRGSGIPEVLIRYLPSMRDDPIQFYTCFISFSTLDGAFADRLHADLQNNGVRCWFAPHDMAGGKKLHSQIDEAIRVYDRLLLILSATSMASNWVRDEIRKARRKEEASGRQVLFPVSLVPFDPVLKQWDGFYDMRDGLNLAEEVRSYYIPDFTGWETNHAVYKAAFDKLLKGLKAQEKPTDTAADD